MRVEIIEVANGWIVRPSVDFNRGEMRPTEETHVFTRFSEMCDFIREQSKIMEKSN